MDITEVTDRDAAYEADTATARRQTFAWSPFLAMDGFLHGAQGSAQGPARCTLHDASRSPARSSGLAITAFAWVLGYGGRSSGVLVECLSAWVFLRAWRDSVLDQKTGLTTSTALWSRATVAQGFIIHANS